MPGVRRTLAIAAAAFLAVTPASAEGITPWATGPDRPALTCEALPRPAAGEVFVVVQFKSGGALPNVTVERVKPGTPERDPRFPSLDVWASGGAVVNVEKGPGKVFLAMSGKSSTVLRFTGAVERLSAVVVDGGFTGPNTYMSSGYMAGVPPTSHGVSGVPKERIAFTGRPDCLHSTVQDKGDYQGDAMLDEIAARFGRRPDLFVMSDKLQKVSLPSGDLVAPTATVGMQANAAPRDVVRRTLESSFPAGTLEVDPASVVARYPVVAPKVPPGLAGLLRMAEDGRVEMTTLSSPPVRMEIRFKAGSEWPLPAVGSTGFEMGLARFVYDPGVTPGGTAWPGACVLADGGERMVSEGNRCAAATGPFPARQAPR